MFRPLLFLLLLLAACGRAPSEAERAFLHSLHGDSLDTTRLRIHDGAPVLPVTFTRKPRPRTACRERILPPVKSTETVKTTPIAVALGNHVFMTQDWYAEDYLKGFPDRLHLMAAMLYAHEATHVWQWQNRRTTGYSPLRAAREHVSTADPYLFDLETHSDFLDYGFEQQGAIMEEYVCCRALDPKGARTKRLHAMLADAMPVAPLPQAREHTVLLPWKGAELAGICN
ncbi:hypothetical protein TRM7557_03249 [Tritonibacter multivorans]|uniref:DUF4157 domain-containing protein n=1 Tax=Tritonibacter multivorans TaxID=928856 RepID=A0A0P1GHE0_9RHOB|nr:hypothetical protein [Tritonibacter multivorans]MDA7420691.1 hypothetical protein [Tritonibacter multivorans]CUH81119.1 hypothetical protein TRM7557_03249 [Tritonibacter multivorans]SFC28699.1 hypothetical protein SAMN04488049_10285 [Tritonibacter multivorans]